MRSKTNGPVKIEPPEQKNIDRVLRVMSGKGGVGKSSIAGLFASSFQRKEMQVGVLDADITGPSIPKMFGATQITAAGPQGILPVQVKK